MIVPSTTWMMAAAVCASALAVAASFYFKNKKAQADESKRKEAKAEYAAAVAELYAAVRGGDANRVLRARRRLCAAKDKAE